jgi:hypothetical protein
VGSSNAQVSGLGQVKAAGAAVSWEVIDDLVSDPLFQAAGPAT